MRDIKKACDGERENEREREDLNERDTILEKRREIEPIET